MNISAGLVDVTEMPISELKALLDERGVDEVVLRFEFEPWDPGSFSDDELRAVAEEEALFCLRCLPGDVRATRVVQEAHRRVVLRQEPHAELSMEPKEDEGWSAPERDVIAGLVCVLEACSRVAGSSNEVSAILLGADARLLHERLKSKIERAKRSVRTRSSISSWIPGGGVYSCPECGHIVPWGSPLCPNCRTEQ